MKLLRNVLCGALVALAACAYAQPITVDANPLATADATATTGASNANVGPITVTPNSSIVSNPSATGGAGGIGGAGGSTGAITVTPVSDSAANAATGAITASPTNTNNIGGTSGAATTAAGNVTANGGTNTISSDNRSNSGASAAGGNGAGNTTSVTMIDRRVAVPPLSVHTPVSSTSSSMLSKHEGSCGPLQQLVRTKVEGTHVGFVSNTRIELGNDFELAPVLDASGKQIYYNEREFDEGGSKVVRRFGHYVVETTGMPNVSSASSFGLGFAGVSGGANAGGGSSSAMSRLVTKITLHDCEVAGGFRIEKVAVVVEPKPVPIAPPAAPSITKAEVQAALDSLMSMRVIVTAPTERVVKEVVSCKMEDFTDTYGRTVRMCRGPSGSYTATRIVKENVTAEGVAQSGGSSTVKK